MKLKGGGGGRVQRHLQCRHYIMHPYDNSNIKQLSTQNRKACVIARYQAAWESALISGNSAFNLKKKE